MTFAAAFSRGKLLLAIVMAMVVVYAPLAHAGSAHHGEAGAAAAASHGTSAFDAEPAGDAQPASDPGPTGETAIHDCCTCHVHLVRAEAGAIVPPVYGDVRVSDFGSCGPPSMGTKGPYRPPRA